MIRPHDDDYKQIKVLGKGAYGEVWLVTNREHQDQQVSFINKKSIILFNLVCNEEDSCENK